MLPERCGGKTMGEWLRCNKLWLGLLADILTFGGGLVLARDAFRHLTEVQKETLENEFRHRFDKLPLADTKLAEAKTALKWAMRGLCVLAAGFVFQVLTRLAE